LEFKNCMFVGMGSNTANYSGGNSVISGFPPTITRQTNFWSRLDGSALTSYSSSGGDINGGTVGFVDAGTNDLHLTGSSDAVGAGTDLSATGFTDDFDGVTRSTWDIGAFAYVA
jgi:hypothetical protein